MIRVNGIEALILEGVGPELRRESDTASFLMFVNQQTAPFAGDSSHRKFQLVPTIATKRSKHVTGKALRVHTQERCARRRIT
jgi:hypothetical protein